MTLGLIRRWFDKHCPPVAPVPPGANPPAFSDEAR